MLDEKRWKRRLDRWLTSEASGRPLILLIVDGLNERVSVHWRPFFSTLLSAPWRDRVAVLATDRPHHWRSQCSRVGLATFHEITVEGYTAAELDQALSARQISHSQIPHDLLPLISIPRYCRLVSDHYQEMIDAADFTRERLIYLEIKDRQESKLQYPLTDERLFEIIRDLAERARVNPELNPKDLRALITVPGGDDANIYEELISGGLLVEVVRNGMIPTYRVEPLRLVFGFGMLLAEELSSRSSAGSSEMEEFLTSWFEPQPDMDRKVEICGSAMFHALFQNDFPEVALRELIRYWLGLRNWADTSQSAFTDYVLRRPEIFVLIAEDFWSSKRDSGAAQEFLGAAFVVHRDDPKVQPVLARAIERWMGFIHPLGGRFWEFHTAGDEQKEERVRKAIETRAGCPVAPGEIGVAGVKITVISDGALLRMARFGLMIMSARDPSPFIHSLVHSAVASAIMDDANFSDLASWVVRLSERDVDSPLLGEACGLLARNEATASAAARILLLTIGSKESKSLIEEHDLTPEWYKEQQKQHASDPCKSMFSWTENESISCLGREDVPLHIILGRAKLGIVDPSVAMPPSLIQRSKESLWSINPAMIRAHSSPTIERHQLEMLTPILCAHAPSELANFMRAVVRTIPDRAAEGQYFLAITLPEISLLLRDGEVSAVSRAITALSADASEWSFQDQSGPRHMRKIAEARAFSGIAPHLSSSDFFRRFITRPANALDLVSFELWFAPVSQDDVREAVRLLHTSPDQVTLDRILWALPTLGVSLSELDRSRLAHLADSDDSKTRSGAVRVAVVAHDKSLGPRIVDLGRVVNKNTDSWEEHWLTLLLAQFGGYIPFEDLAKRLRPSVIGYVLGERGNLPNEIDMYARCLDQEWRRIVSAVDPNIERLPEIAMNTDTNQSGVGMPELHEPVIPPTVLLDRSRSWTSGPPTDSASQLKEMFRTDTEEKVRELNQDLRCKIDAILAAWRTDAFQWYGRAFSAQIMDRLYQRSPALVERWIQPALDDSPTGLSVRVRLGTFLEPICRVLLNRNPQLGLKLWRRLHNREGNPVVINTLDIVFRAEDSFESKLARQTVLDECWNDASIALVAVSCGRSGRHDWLDEVIQELISSQRLWRRAKGLTLASFSDITQERFEDLVSRAAVAGSWIEASLGPLRENVRKNRLARHWYSAFLTAEDSDAAWGAFQIVLSLADERLLNWRVEVEKAFAGGEMTDRRLRFLDLGWNGKRELRQEIGREGARKEKLFGITIQRGEIVPFIET